MELERKDSINVSLQDINSLNIIINDANCLGDFMNDVCQQLEQDGIKFTYTTDCKDIDVNDAVVITLDQQYMAGPGTVIFAPLENERFGNSDALALAAKSAFYEKGFQVESVACGQMGFRQKEDGTVSKRVPTATEEAIRDYTDASYVTISFGTNNNVHLVTESIKGTLVRYCSFLANDYGNTDLIYCVENGQNFDNVADILNSTSEQISAYNDTNNSDILLAGEPIINPVVESMREFDPYVVTDISDQFSFGTK